MTVTLKVTVMSKWINMPINQWWSNNSTENFWIEVTDRQDIGVNLKAPQHNEHGKEFWGYSLIKYVVSGDVVFHYDKKVQAITSKSIATGQFWEDEITWAARGASARDAGIAPHTRSGWYLGLENFEVLDSPLELKTIRQYQSDILRQLNDIKQKPIYFPFAFSKFRDVRPLQGYLFKLPSFFVELFSLNTSKSNKKQIAEISRFSGFGGEYRFADEDKSVGALDPFSRDPSLVERSLNSHARTQNSFANFLREKGLTPLSPKPSDPNFDVAWKKADETWVAEIKSITKENEEKQLRLGLGQLIRYCHLLKDKGEVRGVLVIEREPSDITWEKLCSEHGVILVWPENWHDKLRF